MAGISGKQNTTAYRWWVKHRFGMEAEIAHGASESRSEAETNARNALESAAAQGHSKDGLRAVLYGPRSKWKLDSFGGWMKLP